MLPQIIYTEVMYSKLFCQSYEELNLIRFWDDEIPDMYTHNYTLIKKYDRQIVESISKEIALRLEHNKSFLRVEFNFALNESDELQLKNLPYHMNKTVYDYMYIKTSSFENINGSNDCIVKKAISNQEIIDGINVDIRANQEAMGLDFAQRRIQRKSRVYQNANLPLDMYVCYHNRLPIGNCELMTSHHIVKIEDFDILPDYQRKGFGSSVIKHLLTVSNENNIEHAYLITDSSDTAKDMYKKCGFEKVGIKTELFFSLQR